MQDCPPIVTYEALGGAPEGFRCIARFVCERRVVKGPRKGQMVPDQMPIIIYGDTPSDAHAKAVAWWKAEQDRLEAKRQHMIRLGEARAKRSAA